MEKKINLKKFWPIIVIVAASILIFGKSLFPPPGKMIYGADAFTQSFFYYGSTADSFKSGKIPFWNPNILSGTPYLPLFYPGMIFFMIFPLERAFSYYYFLHILLAGLFTYLMLNKRIDRLSSLFGGCVYAFSALFAGRIFLGHPEYVAGLVYLPLVFFEAVEIMEKIKGNKLKDLRADSLIFVVSLILVILTAVYNLVIFYLILIGLYFLYYNFFLSGKKEWGKKLIYQAAYLGILIFLALGLTAFQLLPFRKFALQNSVRSLKAETKEGIIGSATLATYKLFWDPFTLGSPFSENYSYHGPDSYFGYIFFSGKITLVIIALYSLSQALCFLRRRKTDKYFYFYLLSLGIFLYIALGGNAPYFDLLYKILPIYKFIRGTNRYLMLTVFLLAAASSFALSKIKSPLFKILAIALLLMEMVPFHQKFLRLEDSPGKSSDKKLISFLKENIGMDRLLIGYNTWSYFVPKYQINNGLLTKIPATSGYTPLILVNYYRFIDAANKAPTPSYQFLDTETPKLNPWSGGADFLNIKYILNESLYDNIGRDVPGRFKQVLKGEGFNLYENLQVLPRFFLVSKVFVYPDLNQIDAAIRGDNIDLSNSIHVVRGDFTDIKETETDCGEVKDLGEVKILSYENEKISLWVKANCNAFLSSSEVYYPQWQAKIDGKRVKIYKSNLAFRGIKVTPGVHEVVMEYVPVSFYLGLIVSLISAIFLLFLIKSLKRNTR